MGSLKLEPAVSRLDLLAAPVAAALQVWPAEAPIDGDQVMVAPIDPDLADTAAFKHLVLGASAVVYNNASSGIYAVKLMDKLGLAPIIGSKIVVVKSGAAIMEYVAAHPPAAVGLAQISEIMVLIAKGCPVRLAAPLPDEIQNSTTYFAAVMADAAAQMAGSLVRFLTTPAAKSAFAATGID